MGPGVFKMEDISETLETSHRASHLLSYWAHKNTEDCRDLIYHDILSPSVLLWRVPGQRRDANKKVTKNECSHSRDPVRRPHHSLTQHPLITSTFNGHPHTRSSPGPPSSLHQISGCCHHLNYLQRTFFSAHLCSFVPGPGLSMSKSPQKGESFIVADRLLP